LIYTGRLAPEKNLDFLLKAFAGVIQAVDNVRLLLVGDGPVKDELKKLATDLQIADNVTFTGLISYNNLPGYLAMCDIFVFASISETFGLVIVEAMGSGLPVMGIHSPGVSDIVEDGKTGFLSTRDLSAFTAKLTRLCLQKQLHQEMGRTAREASKKYDIELTTQIMLKHYEKLANAPRQPRLDWDDRLLNILERFRA
jgi:glycosyltransferase involved in cell wall biosynthesis